MTGVQTCALPIYGYCSIALFLHGIERGVAVFPGPMHDLDHRFINAFRLSYGSVSLEQIQEGIELLEIGSASCVERVEITGVTEGRTREQKVQ